MKEIVPLADYCLDFHTGAANRFNAAQVRINDGDKESLELAKVFGAPFIVQSKQRQKSYRESAIKLGKKVLLYEGGKSIDFDRSITNTGVNGALNIMHHLGIRDFDKEIKKRTKTKKLSSVVISKSKWIRARYSGMFRTNANLGKLYKKGDKIGSISDPFGFFERDIKAPNKGYIFCLNHAPIVNKGDAIFHISVEE